MRKVSLGKVQAKHFKKPPLVELEELKSRQTADYRRDLEPYYVSFTWISSYQNVSLTFPNLNVAAHLVVPLDWDSSLLRLSFFYIRSLVSQLTLQYCSVVYTSAKITYHTKVTTRRQGVSFERYLEIVQNHADSSACDFPRAVRRTLHPPPPPPPPSVQISTFHCKFSLTVERDLSLILHICIRPQVYSLV